MLERAGIADIADRRVGKCSGGEQQRLRFAMALLSDPALLLLDEPTTGMDVEGRRAFWSAIRADAAQGRTVLFATHYLEEADQYADRIVLISQGRIVADGTGSRDQGARRRAAPSGRRCPAPTTSALCRARRASTSVEVRGDAVYVHAKDTDAVARYLLTETDARDLEITAHGLEDAFLSLTGDDADDQTRSPKRRTDAVPTQRDRPDHPPGAAAGRLQPHLLGIELKRMLRNRRTIIFTLVFPAALFLIFGSAPGRQNDRAGAGQRRGVHHVSMALYGAALIAATSGGAMVAIERALGWSRQLRLTR